MNDEVITSEHDKFDKFQSQFGSFYMVLLKWWLFTCLGGCIDALWCLSCLVMIGVHHQLTIFQRLMEPQKHPNTKGWKKRVLLSIFWETKVDSEILRNTLRSTRTTATGKQLLYCTLKKMKKKKNSKPRRGISLHRCAKFLFPPRRKKTELHPPKILTMLPVAFSHAPWWDDGNWRNTERMRKKRLEGHGDVAAWRYGPLLHRLPLTSVFYNIMRYYLVGGWTDPLWKICNRQNGFFFPKVWGENSNKYLSCHHQVMNRFFDNSVGYFEQKIIIFKCLATTLEIQHLKCCLWVTSNVPAQVNTPM